MKKSTIILALLITVCFNVNAQKLPNIQSESVVAPANIRIDGKLTEWGNTLQAYNKAIECSYTLANDASNLYVVLQATDHGIIARIALGGITFSVPTTVNKSKSELFSVTFLKTPAPYPAGISYELRSRKSLPDSVALRLNNQIFKHIKDIGISGIKGVSDSEISIYNDLGIKTAGTIDQSKIYSCELVIPLKYLSNYIESDKLNYQLQINGMDTTGKDGFKVVGGSRAGVQPSAMPADASSINFLTTPTYLKGIYKLKNSKQ